VTMAKGLTRKITRKQARSYDRLQPNARGVTALVEVNGPGAYQHRYAQSRQILSNGVEGMYTARQRSAMKKMSPKRRASFQKMLKRAPSIGAMRANRGKKKATKRKAAARRKPVARRRAAPKKASKRLTKTQFLNRQKRRGRSAKQSQNDWKLSRKAAAKRAPKRRKPRTYGKGKFKALRSRVGSKSRHTYMYRTKRGGTRHIPEYAALGYKSEKDMIRLSSTAKGAAAYVKRKEKLDVRRSKAAERAARQIRAGRGMFTPNEGDIITFEEWKKMRPNAAKKRKKTTKRRKKTGWTKAKRVAAGKKAARTRKRRLTSRKSKPAKRKAVSRRKPRYGTKAWYRWIGKKGAAARKRGKGRKRPTAKRRKRTTTRRAKRMTITMTANRRRRRSRSRRTYRRNVSASMFVTELKNALKLGALVTVGYVAHRAGTKLLSDQVLSKIGAFQTGTLGEYRGIISAALMAAIGVPLTVRVAPKQAVPVAAGMAASLIHGAVMLMLTKMDQHKALPYLSAYPNAEGAAYGSYYAFQPHQQMGQAPMMQAAAAYPPMQAAAGMQGMGQPVLAQAAAGMGEYYAYGADGIGEYEEVPPMNTGPVGQIDEGIYPNLHSAEQALSFAEAAAGVGGADVPMMSTVSPTVIADPVQELPGGSRAGVFQGGDGIFG